jgi:hypothetical protein
MFKLLNIVKTQTLDPKHRWLDHMHGNIVSICAKATKVLRHLQRVQYMMCTVKLDEEKSKPLPVWLTTLGLAEYNYTVCRT